MQKKGQIDGIDVLAIRELGNSIKYTTPKM